jgi:hypothetical protein
MPQLFDFERVLFDYVIPVDREARELQLATSGAKAARIVFLTSSTIFLSDRAFAPTSECYAGNDSNIVCLRLIRRAAWEICSGHARDLGEVDP